MNKGILRFIIGLVLTYGMWYWYNTNVLSKLDIEGQLAEFESEYDNSDYEREDDGDYAYDDYDTESDW